MKTKKRGAYAALAAVLLISAVLITSCPESINLGGLTIPQNENPEVQLPAGKAYLTVNIGSSSNGRTITPTLFIDHYVLTITRTDDTSATTPEGSKSDTIGSSSTSHTIAATVGGTYNTTLIAYATNGNTNPIATASQNGTTIVAGGNTLNFSLTLNVSTATTDPGTFKWNITLPTTPTTRVATLTLYDDIGGTAITGVDGIILSNSGNNNNTSGTGVSVPAGVYYVTVLVTADEHASYRKTDVVHIYSHMTTTYTDTTLPTALTPNTYTITYANYDGRGNGTTNEDTQKQRHGVPMRNYYDTGAGLAGPPALHTSVATTTMLGYTFGGWFKDTGLSNEWIFATDVPIRATTLYGRWVAPIGITVSITPPDAPDSTTFDVSSANTTISIDTLAPASGTGGNPNVQITIGDNLATGWNNFTWIMNHDFATDKPLSGGNGTGILLNFTAGGNAGVPPIGTVTITFKADKDPGGITYSGTFTFTITP